MTNDEVIKYIRDVSVPLHAIEGRYVDTFRWLSDEIYQGKALIETNSVQFIIAKVLNRQHQIRDISRKDSFTVYVVGSFKKSFIPVQRVAEAFANFYIEMGVLPNIIPISQSTLVNHPELLPQIKYGILLYERR